MWIIDVYFMSMEHLWNEKWMQYDRKGKADLNNASNSSLRNSSNRIYVIQDDELKDVCM